MSFDYEEKNNLKKQSRRSYFDLFLETNKTKEEAKGHFYRKKRFCNKNKLCPLLFFLEGGGVIS